MSHHHQNRGESMCLTENAIIWSIQSRFSKLLCVGFTHKNVPWLNGRSDFVGPDDNPDNRALSDSASTSARSIHICRDVSDSKSNHELSCKYGCAVCITRHNAINDVVKRCERRCGPPTRLPGFRGARPSQSDSEFLSTLVLCRATVQT